MESQFQQLADEGKQPQQAQPQQQPTQPAGTQSASDGLASTFQQMADTEKQAQPVQTATQDGQNKTGNDAVAQHGLLRRAWDFINSPIADLTVAGHRLLPEGVKTADIIKAAAFEKMYGEAYIPGFNDFDTKAESHFGSAPAKMTLQDGHPYVATPESHAFKNAVRTFIAGSAKDASDMAAGFTSPVGIATTAAGFGPEAKAGTALAKAATAGKVLTGTAFGLKGVSDIYTAGTENTPEAWQQRLQGAAQVAGGAALAAEPMTAAVSKVAPKVQGAAETVKNVAKGGQPKLQAAIRDAAQTGAEKSALLSSHPDILDKQVEAPAEDVYPVKLVYDEDGNVADIDGRHRVIQAIDEGKESIPVQVTLRDGTTATVQQDPNVVAEKFGVTKESLAATDAQQSSVRTGNGQPRQPVVKPAATQPEPTPTVKTGGVRTAIEDVSNDVKAKSQKLYQQLDKESGGRWQRYEDQIKNLEDKMNEVNGIDDDAYDRLETKRNDIETSQAQMLEDMKAKGLDPKIAEDAVAHYKQAMALRDLDKAVKGSVTGDARISGKEVVNPKMFTNRVQKLYDSGRLQQALGEEGAGTLLKEAYRAKTALSIKRWSIGILAAAGLLGHRAWSLIPAAAE